MTDHRAVAVAPSDGWPAGHRAIPLLAEHDLAHYPEFRDFLARTFPLDRDPFGPPGLLRVGDRTYQLVFFGRSGHAFSISVSIDALVPGLEPIDERASRPRPVGNPAMVGSRGRPRVGRRRAHPRRPDLPHSGSDGVMTASESCRGRRCRASA